MAEVKKARLFLRRGTDTDRQDTVLCQGELGYSTDAFRVFVGDGVTQGGNPVGMMAFVSAGKNFQTDLTEASASGLALSGDIAVFPSSNWTNAGGGTTSIDSSHATTVMLLTGTNPATSSHWVNINNNIPFGNISISEDDISGNYVSGGAISGPITLSGGQVKIGGDGTTENLILSGVALSAHLAASDKTAFEGNVNKVYPVGITGTSQLTVLSSSYEFENSGKENMSNNYYYDYYATLGASPAAQSNEDALTAAVNTNMVDNAAENSLLFIRNIANRRTGGGNGANARNMVYITQFILVAESDGTIDGSNVSNWRMITQHFNNYRGSFTTVGGTGGLAVAAGGVG